MSIVVYRRRKTRRRWALASDKVRVGATCLPHITGLEPIRKAMMFEFELSSAGGGSSVIQLDVRPAAFQEIMETMSCVDLAATRAAIAYAETLVWEELGPDDLKDGDYLPV
jgi:hypothetical protein